MLDLMNIAIYPLIFVGGFLAHKFFFANRVHQGSKGWTNREFDSTLTLAGLFIPGALFLLSIYGIFPEVKGVVLHVWNGYKITGLILMGGVCFIAAGLIDFLWATLTSLVQWIQSFGKRSASFFEKLKIFDSLTVRTYKYRYSIFNFSLSILVVWGLARLKESERIAHN